MPRFRCCACIWWLLANIVMHFIFTWCCEHFPPANKAKTSTHTHKSILKKNKWKKTAELIWKCFKPHRVMPLRSYTFLFYFANITMSIFYRWLYFLSQSKRTKKKNNKKMRNRYRVYAEKYNFFSSLLWHFTSHYILTVECFNETQFIFPAFGSSIQFFVLALLLYTIFVLFCFVSFKSHDCHELILCHSNRKHF